jgi:hypothetical protein
MVIEVQAEDGLGLGRTGQMEPIKLPGPRPGDEPDTFEFVFPRMGDLLELARGDSGLNEMDAATSWLSEGFGEEAWAYIEARLAKPRREDLLDREHMIFLFRKLSENKTGRPTTSSNGASRQPWKRSQTAAPSTPESGSPTSPPETFAT